MLRKELSGHAPGLTPAAVLLALSGIRTADVRTPTTDERRPITPIMPITPRHTEPEPRHEVLPERPGLTLPHRPPPRIRSGQLAGTPT